MKLLALALIILMSIGFAGLYFWLLYSFMKRVEAEHGEPVKQQLMKMVIRNPHGH